MQDKITPISHVYTLRIILEATWIYFLVLSSYSFQIDNVTFLCEFLCICHKRALMYNVITVFLFPLSVLLSQFAGVDCLLIFCFPATVVQTFVRQLFLACVVSYTIFNCHHPNHFSTRTAYIIYMTPIRYNNMYIVIHIDQKKIAENKKYFYNVVFIKDTVSCNSWNSIKYSSRKNTYNKTLNTV